MHADVAGQVFQPAGQIEQFADGFAIAVALHHFLELRLLLQRLGQRYRLVLDDRDQLGDAVAHRVRQAEHATDVTDHRLRRHGAESGDLADRVLAIVLTHILDDTPAVVLAEVDVEVGHRHPLRVQEALEQQRIRQRVEVGDAQRVGDQRAGAGAPAGPYRHAVVLGPVDEVGNDQEVAGEAHLDDGVALELQALVVFRPALRAHPGVGIELGEADLQPFLGLGDEELVDGHARWNREIGQEVLAQRQFDIAAPGDFQRVFQRFRQVGEQFGHFRLGLEILLFRINLRPPGVAEHIAFGDADARLVRPEIVAVHELDRVRGNQRNTGFAGQIGGLLDDGFLLRLAVALNFQIEGAGKDRFPAPGAFHCQIEVAVEQRFTNIAQMSAGQRDQTIRADFGKPFSTDFGAITTPFDCVGTGQQLAQLTITLTVTDQQQQATGIFRRLRVGDPDVGTG